MLAVNTTPLKGGFGQLLLGRRDDKADGGCHPYESGCWT